MPRPSRHAVGATALTLAVALGAGGALAARSPSGATPAAASPANGSPTASPASGPVPGWVAVPVASVWASPRHVRTVDRPAVTAAPGDVSRWLGAMSIAQRRDLTDRLYTQAIYGDEVEVLRTVGTWREVRVGDQRGSYFKTGIVGWMPAAQVTTRRPAPAPAHVTVAADRAWLHATRGDGTPGPRLMLLSYGTRLPALNRHDGWYTVARPGGGTGAIAASVVRTGTPAGATGVSVVREARRFLGLPYLWAGTSAYGYDCSGLTYAVFRELGVRLNRNAADQTRQGRPVARADLRPGDLVFFGRGDRSSVHHVGIYAGGGRMIDAPRTGQSVRLIRIAESGLGDQYWGGRRYLPAG